MDDFARRRLARVQRMRPIETKMLPGPSETKPFPPRENKGPVNYASEIAERLAEYHGITVEERLRHRPGPRGYTAADIRTIVAARTTP
jgi:hypothetical protein